MAIIPIYEVTKTAMIDKVEGKILQVAGVLGVEKTYLSLDKGKWFVVIKQSLKNSSKKRLIVFFER